MFLDKNGRASIGVEAIFALKEEHLLSQRLEPLHLTAYVPRLPIPPPEDHHVYDMVQLMPCHKGDAKHLKVWVVYIFIWALPKLIVFHRDFISIQIHISYHATYHNHHQTKYV